MSPEPAFDPRAPRRIALALFAAQALSSSAMVLAATVAPLAVTRLAGSASWAGAPVAVAQGGAAAVAFLWGALMDRIGRRHTLAIGASVGAAGAALAAWAVAAGMLWPYLAGVSLMGVANGALLLGRFVAAEVAAPEARGRAISTVVLGGTVGAILGPSLVSPTSAAADRFRLELLAGPFAGSSAIFVAVSMLVLLWLRPEPRELARLVASARAGGDAARAPRRPLREIVRLPAARVAVASLVFAQAVMVMLMVVTAVHMDAHHHALSGIAAVISSHVLGMYAFSFVSGRLADVWGKTRVIAAGAVLLGLGCARGTLSPGLLPLAGALFVLGLGWNLCHVGGSALLADQLRPDERGRAQGLADSLVGAASAGGALLSGVLFSGLGYAGMAWLAGAASLVPLVLATRRPAAQSF